MNQPTILAFDFDGVLCNGLVEYFQTAWQVYSHLWQVDPSKVPIGLAEQFYQLRPVIETGWEMPLLIHALVNNVSHIAILENWQAICQEIMVAEKLQASQLATAIDGFRDTWIAQDLEGWLAKHQFYPGVIDRLRCLLNSPIQIFIITTKEGRFVRQLLTQQGITIPHEQIFGKECRQPKHQTLRSLLNTHPNASIWFIEDRLKTLQSIQQQSDLAAVQLFLADWGYNTASERALTEQDAQIRLLTLNEFTSNFARSIQP